MNIECLNQNQEYQGRSFFSNDIHTFRAYGCCVHPSVLLNVKSTDTVCDKPECRRKNPDENLAYFVPYAGAWIPAHDMQEIPVIIPGLKRKLQIARFIILPGYIGSTLVAVRGIKVVRLWNRIAECLAPGDHNMDPAVKSDCRGTNAAAMQV